MAANQNKPAVEPQTQAFLDSLSGAPPLHTLSYSEAHDVLTDLQSNPVKILDAQIKDVQWPVGPTGSTRIRIIRPLNKQNQILPVILYTHGGGWILGNKITHDRLVRELAVEVDAAVVFVDYLNAPEAKHPTQIEQSYGALEYLVEHAADLNIDATRIAIVGDSVGGAMAAALTLLAKQRGGPHISYQVLFYPVTDFASDNDSYKQFADGPWLTEKTMRWMFEAQGLNGSENNIAYPNRSTREQLEGLPNALIITDDDILRDEGESYGRELAAAGVRVAAVRYLGTIHDFVMLNAIHDTPAARSAVALAIDHLQDAFNPQ
ncbi:alpha/beta hydrolase [Planctomicrobium sp. SH527]|uniref:alpha/beta hydrolase n=1 Tax=Planctomicrobium sp. SH527 TaxID=3448123 RepID=UPI003F5C4D31